MKIYHLRSYHTQKWNLENINAQLTFFPSSKLKCKIFLFEKIIAHVSFSAIWELQVLLWNPGATCQQTWGRLCHGSESHRTYPSVMYKARFETFFRIYLKRLYWLTFDVVQIPVILETRGIYSCYRFVSQLQSLISQLEIFQPSAITVNVVSHRKYGY